MPVRPKGSASTLEARRRLAARYLAQGLGIREVARRMGAAPSSVKRWKDALEDGGKTALKAKPHAGRPSRLSPKQRDELVRVLFAGTRASGFSSGQWTCWRVGQVISQRFGVRYHPDHVSRILRGLGWRYEPSTQRGKRSLVPPHKRRWLAG